jgi:hypothetical protein
VVGPPLAAAPIVFWYNRETTDELQSSWPIIGEECGLEKSVVLARKNRRRLLKNISSVSLVMISCVMYSPP